MKRKESAKAVATDDPVHLLAWAALAAVVAARKDLLALTVKDEGFQA